jgi:hypothetical protein
MQVKMELLEAAMGIICNGRAFDEAFDEDWEKAKREWISVYEMVIRHQKTKKQNQRTATINEFLTETGR